MKNPPYIQWPGDQQVSPPYTFTDVTSQCYVLPADWGQLQRLCDERLNIAPHRLRYLNLFPCVFVQVNSYPSIVSAAAPRQVMSAEEVALSLWLFREPDLGLPFFQPYLFINNPWSVATGREIFGFNKQQSEFNFGLSATGAPDPRQPSAGQQVSSLVFRDSQCELSLQEVLAIETGLWDEPEQRGAKSVLTDPAEALRALAKELDSQFAGGSRYLETMSRHLKPELEFDTLKQFRDAEMPSQACYQAVVSTKMWNFTNFKFSLLVDGLSKLKLSDYASLPVTQLGIQSTAPRVAFELRFDCSFGSARNLFVNSGPSGCLAIPLDLCARLFGGLFGGRGKR